MATKTKAKPKHKTNALMPSMREGKRYAAFEIITDKPLSYEADKLLVSRINQTLGTFESARANVMNVKYNAKLQRGLLRVDRNYVDTLRSCFVLIKDLNGQKALIRTLRVSGMLNKALPITGLEQSSKAR